MSQVVGDEMRKALNHNPEDPAAMLVYANTLLAHEHYAAAYHFLRRLVSLSPSEEALLQYGRSLAILAATAGDDAWLQRAERVFMDVVHRYPESVSAVTALGACAVQLGNFGQGEELLRLAHSHRPDDLLVAQVLAHCLFTRGAWGEGFDFYEKVIDGSQRFIPKDPDVPYWDGTKGKRLLVVGEQGIGDEISFASMLPDAARENDITFMCTPALEGLMRRSLPGVKVEGTRQAKADGPMVWKLRTPFGTVLTEVSDPPSQLQVEAKCLLASLGRHYRRSSSDFPRKGYLIADPARRAYYREAFDKLPGRKIGIAWTGGLSPSFWHRRGLDRASLKRLLEIPNASFVSLQYQGGAPDNVRRYPMATSMHIDYDETAALVAELDEVITVTTAIAHLCGALGKKAHVLVNKIPRWFYGLEGSDHTWYESLILHRETDAGWPIDELKEALA